MNFIAWAMALTLMVTFMFKAVAFQRATVCRQKAWLKGTELETAALLHQPKDHAHSIDLKCNLYVTRKFHKISWRRLPNLKAHQFELPLRGML